jgi:hypothetical protein
MKKQLADWIKDWDKNKRRFGIKSGDEVIRFDESGMCFKQNMNGLNMFWEWELIPQNVSFMEAVKAYSEGKTIRCEWEGRTEKWESTYKNGSPYCGILENDGAICAKEILNGVWYVEE